MEKIGTTSLVPAKEIIEKLENAGDIRFCNQEFTKFCNIDCRGRYGCAPFCPVYKAWLTATQQLAQLNN